MKEVEVAIDRYASELARLGDRAHKIMATAIRASGRAITKDVSERITDRYAVNGTSLKRGLRATTRSGAEAMFTITASGRRLHIGHFQNNPGMKHVNVWILKGSRLVYERAFYWQGEIWQRTGRPRLPIHRPGSPSVAQMMDHDSIMPEFTARSAEALLSAFDRGVARELKKDG